MRKVFLMGLTLLFLSGCGTAAKESEFWKHDTMYKDWSHFKYSISGYKNPTAETMKESKAEDWWGIPVPGK